MKILIICTIIGFVLVIIALLFLARTIVKVSKNSKVIFDSITRQLKGEIKAQGNTFQEWNDQRKLDIKALQETTVKAYEASGELIITSPDGKTKIDEFKIKKGA